MIEPQYAGVVELADTSDLSSDGRCPVQVQVLLPAPLSILLPFQKSYCNRLTAENSLAKRALSEAYGTVITLFRLISVAVTYTKTANQMGM